MGVQSLPMQTGYRGAMPNCIVTAIHVVPRTIFSSVQPGSKDAVFDPSIDQPLESKVEIVTLSKLLSKIGSAGTERSEILARRVEAPVFHTGPR
jgi:hypothetical protein